MSSPYSLTENQSRAFDFIKFVAAIIIVAAHTQFLKEYDTASDLFGRLNCICIPIFFAISSYLFTIRLQRSSAQPRECLMKTLKRLAILFAVWYIIMFHQTWEGWFMKATMKETIAAVLFGCTFGAYWFIKALIINTIIIYACFRNKTVSTICLIFFSLYYIFTAYNYIYHFVNLPFSPYFNFAYHVVPCMIGLFAAKRGTFNLFNTSPVIALCLFILLAILRITTEWSEPLYRVGGAYLICILIERITFPQHLPYKHFRKASTLLYMSQFLLMSLVSMYIVPIFPIFSNSIYYTLLVLTASTIFSYCLITASTKNGLKKLSYAY